MRSTTTLSQQAPAADVVRGGAAGAVEAPRSVIRGAKSQEPNTVSIDWLRLSGPRSSFYEALALLEKRFGPTEPGAGRFFVNTGYHWPEGGVFRDEQAERNKDYCVVELPGKLISELEHEAVQRLLYELTALGFRTTRIDVALDFFDRPRLIETVAESCEAGELCRSRTYQRITQCSLGALVAHGVNIGQRGKKGSGRYLRVYDKGLEQKTHDPGEWIRWEVELSDDCAQQFAMRFAQAEDTIECCVTHALWVVEFRQVTGSRMLERRPLAPWFEIFTQRVRRERLTAVRAKSTVESYARWVRTAVVPKLQSIAKITRTPVGGVIAHIAGNTKPRTDHAMCPKVRAISESMGVDPRTIRTRLRVGGCTDAP